MVSCPKCSINNTLDSLFCRKCGVTLPPSVIEDEQAKLKEMVSKGMHFFENGNSEEAMAIAEHSVMSNPSYAEGYALKGYVHEKRGEYAQALDCFETVVSLNPDSAMDKFKLNQLRNAFANRQAGGPQTDRKSAALMAAAATLLIASVGFISMRLVQTSATKTVSSSNVPLNLSNQTGDSQPKSSSNPAQSSVSTPTNPTPQPSLTSQPAPGDVPAVRTNENADRDRTERVASRALPSSRRSSAPEFFEPVTPSPMQGEIGRSGGSRGSLPAASGGSVPSPSNTPSSSQGGSVGNDPRPIPMPREQKPEENPGQISVSISKGSSKSQASQSGDNFTKVGNERMKSGDTEGAAKAYDAASKSGSSSGRTYQRQAQALKRQGKDAEAANAYRKAIEAYETDIRSGKGNKEANEAGLAACRQALKVIGN